MTDPQLRALLEERVSDLTTTDLAGAAWGAGVVVRRRRRGYVAAAAAAAVVVTLVATPVVLRRDSSTTEPASGTQPSGRQTFLTECDTCDRAAVTGPTRAEEAGLPAVSSSLPPLLDAGVLTDGPTGPASVAVGLALADGSVDVRLLEPSGWHGVDTSGLEPYLGEAPLVDGMLAPDGRHVLFPQPRSVAVYDVLAETWSNVAVDRLLKPGTVSWSDASSFSVLLNGSPGLSSQTFDVPDADVERDPSVFPVGAAYVDPAHGYGPVVGNPAGSVAQAAAFVDHDEIVLDPPGGALREGLVRVRFDTGPGADRTSPCCPVIGWLDDDHVVYVSRGPVTKLVAWDVEDDTFSLVTALHGVPASADVRIGVADLTAR